MSGFNAIFFSFFREFHDFLRSFEDLAGRVLRPESRVHPDASNGGFWPPVRVLSLTFELKLCSSYIEIECAHLVLAC